jgi:acyl carrier protein
VDSLTLMNIVMELEDVFELSIPLDRLADVETVGDLAALINELRARA